MKDGTYKSLFPAIGDVALAVLAALVEKGGTATTQDVYPLVTASFPGLSAEALHARQQRGDNAWENHIRWARERLKHHGYLASGGRGVWKITESGRSWLMQERRPSSFVKSDEQGGHQAEGPSTGRAVRLHPLRGRPEPPSDRASGLSSPRYRPLAIFDLDYTVRNPGPAQYPKKNQVSMMPGMPERLLQLKELGYLLAGATNQAGVTKGIISAQEAQAAIDRTQELLQDAALDYAAFCPHHQPTDGFECDCKKPAGGLVINALDALPEATLEGSFVVGDNEYADGGMARSLGLPFIDVNTFRRTPVTQLQSLIESVQPKPVFCTPTREQALGVMIGLAVADALGAPLEFKPREQVRRLYPQPLDRMIASGQWEKGEYTDDTAMALMLAAALAGNLSDLPGYFKTWARGRGIQMENGPFIANKDIGIWTSAVLSGGELPKASLERYRKFPGEAAGNGALMRCAPVALYASGSLPMLIARTRQTARLTHADPKAQSSCVILNVWIRSIFANGKKDGRTEALSLLTGHEREKWKRLETIEKLPESDIQSSGYTVHTLEAAAWSFLTTGSFKDAVVRAANLGHDADTVAAVTGALAGAYYGWDAIPMEWRSALKHAEYISQLALVVTEAGRQRFQGRSGAAGA